LSVGFLFMQAGASAAGPPRITKPVQATTGDVDPARTYSGPSVAIDPENPMTVVAAMGEMRTRRCYLVRSADAGHTWKRLDTSPSTPSYPFCLSTNFAVGMAHVAFGRHHTLYYALPGWDTQDRLGGAGDVSVLLGRSTDLGDSWQTTLVDDVRGKQGDQVESNRPVTSLSVDTHSGSQDIVYVGWFRSFPNLLAPNLEPVHPMVGVSSDGGKTFAPPVDVSKGAFDSPAVRTQAFQGTTTVPTLPGATTTTAVPGSRAAQPDLVANFGGRDTSVAVGNNGTVYVAWRSQTANHNPRPLPALFLSKSTDKGKTFTVSQITPFTYNIGGQPVLRWSPKGGADGTLHLVYEGTTRPQISGEADIDYQRSTDGGKTWSEPKILNDDDPAKLYAQHIPTIAVAPNGRLDAAWWDFRNDPGINGNDVYHASSADNGLTWSANDRITDQLDDRRVGVFGNNFDVTAPPGLASTNAYLAVGWDDTRNSKPGELGAGTQDVFVASVQYRALGGGSSKATKLVLAGVGGLLVVGLALVVGAFATRRKTDRPESSAVGRLRSPADVN
jgi:hypothetical protein